MLLTYQNTQDGPQNPDCISCTEPKYEKHLLGFSNTWKVLLHPFQDNLGSCLVTTRRHVNQVTDLSKKELLDFQAIMKHLEDALKVTFKIDLLNYLCLMNWAYRKPNPVPKFKDGQPNPHVHWHIITRYERPIDFCGYRFEDPNFGNPHDTTRNINIPDEVKEKIKEEILSYMDVRYIDC
jgi:diadenosine tetraphosphate (Ap4A) HIT family hydrolase